ncbi:CaiB/BaiF CoA transferase family protein [Cryptosporangium minutisporangium]|uniref:Alpha-methylacyl-CoA racemase n=1 Tax=Cryptosporangium minutisporangium TaxID=113569 RepID=A0ABP6SR18_9ACTN
MSANENRTSLAGPLDGVRVIELAGQGPGPYACMLLAGLGADVIRVDRLSAARPTHPETDIHARGRRSIALDLKQPRAVEIVLDLIEGADVLIEGYRPGVTERLGLGPAECLRRNPRLVYGRMTGWGQDGPLAQAAGHDINYLALTGALHAVGEQDGSPVPPLNLVADYGGGGAMLALGVLAALLDASSSGQGQVVDAAMVDGVATMMAPFYALAARGAWVDERGSNILDGAAPFYGVYRTSDDRFVAVGAIEPQFYARLLAGLGLDPAELPPQLDRAGWPAVKARVAEIFATRSRDEWTAVFDGEDACVTPVLSLREAVATPLARARGMFPLVDGVPSAAPAPRFSRCAPAAPGRVEASGASTDAVLRSLGLEESDVAKLRETGVAG